MDEYQQNNDPQQLQNWSADIYDPEPRFWHTVGDLMNILRKFPANMPVVISGQEDGYENFFYPYSITVRHDSESYFKYGEFQPARENETDTYEVLILQRVVRE